VDPVSNTVGTVVIKHARIATLDRLIQANDAGPMTELPPSGLGRLKATRRETSELRARIYAGRTRRQLGL